MLRGDVMLLGKEDPAPVRILRGEGCSEFLLTCDHAGNLIPASLQQLGLPHTELERHIAWDIGAAHVVEALAGQLDATAVLQTYSRLVVDCNRPLGSPTLIAATSEYTDIPGNQSLSHGQRAERIAAIHQPYHQAIQQILDERLAQRRFTIVVAMHSFTPQFKGISRPWHVGVLYNRDRRFAGLIRDLLSADNELVVGDNQPYAITDGSDYTIPVHGELRSLPHVELEIRQDLIGDSAGQLAWAARLAEALQAASLRLTAGLNPI